MCSFRARGPTFIHTPKGNISDFERFLCTFGGQDPILTYTEQIKSQISKEFCATLGTGTHFFIHTTKRYNIGFQRVPAQLRDPGFFFTNTKSRISQFKGFMFTGYLRAPGSMFTNANKSIIRFQRAYVQVRGLGPKFHLYDKMWNFRFQRVSVYIRGQGHKHVQRDFRLLHITQYHLYLSLSLSLSLYIYM